MFHYILSITGSERNGRHNITVKMIDKERWKILFVILTLVERAESDFIGELQVRVATKILRRFWGRAADTGSMIL